MLDVLLEEDEWWEVREAASRRGIGVEDWVRLALREAYGREANRDLGEKLRAIRAAARHDFPTADVDEMADQIKRGYSARGSD
jgi:hypothetical protein